MDAFSSAQELLDQPPNEDQPGCILLDVRLPDLSGHELQTRLNERGFGLPVIFLTGYHDINSAVRAIKAGAEDVLIKPVKSNDLLGAIERAIARRENSRASTVAPDRSDEFAAHRRFWLYLNQYRLSAAHFERTRQPKR